MAKEYTVRCKNLDNEGRGEVLFNGSTFSVAGLLPGEKCTMSLVYGKKETGAKVTKILEPSALRTEPACRAFSSCGGCSLMHMKYEAELEFKQNKINSLFAEYNAEILPVIGMQNPLNYRHKIYTAFDVKRNGKHHEIIAGLYEENTRKVVKVKNCLIQNKTANHIIKTIVDTMNMTHTFPYNPETGKGTLRHVYMRVSKSTGKVMVVLVTGTEMFRTAKQFVLELTGKHPEIETVIHNVNSKKTGMVLGEKSRVLFGPGFITDTISGITFKIFEKTFYQVNPVQVEKLYEEALEMAELSEKDSVLDAYCGIGTISLLAAKKAGKVTGVEINPDSVRAAKENAEFNKLENVSFFAADASDFLQKGMAKRENPASYDVVMLDPPRSGAEPEFLTSLILSSPKKIVYVSCNPDTLKRDINILVKGGYRVQKVRPVDMFPHTSHVETVCLLSKKCPV